MQLREGVAVGERIGFETQVQRVHTGTVELVAERRVFVGFETLRANLRDRVCLLLVMIIMAAQTADILTTSRALAGNAYVEENPLFRVLILNSPVAAYAIKLLVIVALTVLALSNLRGRRAAVALGLAAAISVAAPVMNFGLLSGS
jgi:hypothetical protein